jgi:HSP20 family protein
MRRDDRDDPFEDIFQEIERMMNEMVGQQTGRGFESSGFEAVDTTHVDVYDDDGTVRVVADLPGVAKSDISLQCDGEVVTIAASNETRQYDERVSLPARVDPETGAATYNNGVLEVTFERDESATDIDVE